MQSQPNQRAKKKKKLRKQQSDQIEEKKEKQIPEYIPEEKVKGKQDFEPLEPEPLAEEKKKEDEEMTEEIEEEKKGFPHSLGPFGIKTTTFKGASFSQISWGSPNQGGMFAMEKTSFGHSASLRAFSNYVQDWPIIGQFSPAHPITLSTVEKKAALIPVDASSFVWSYPVAIQIDPTKAKGIDWADPDIAFLTVGGYVYFNNKNLVCGVNTIIPSISGLQFSKPKKWNHDYTHFLQKDGRFQSITIKALNDCGAWYFAWIRPDEPLKDSFNVEEKICPNGGFVYLFHQKVYDATDEEKERDCYFHVLNGEEYAAQVEKEKKFAEKKRKLLEDKKKLSDVKIGVKKEPQAFPLVGMLDQLNELFDEQTRLNEDRKRQEQEQREVVDSSARKLVFLDKPINTWTIEMVGIWLDSVEFHSYKDTFRQQMIDGETLLDLDELTIRTLVKEFHIKKMLRLIERLRIQQQTNQAVRKTIEDQKTLEEKIEDLKQQIETARTCVLCIDLEKNVKFNCGHVVACSECAKKISDCPVCREPITKRETVYLS